mgnify:FL=1
MSTPDPLPPRLRGEGRGHRVDLLVGVCAILISAVSLFIAERSNHTQERMLAASVWPFLSWDTSNYNDQMQREEVSLDLANDGVGPARIETVEIAYKGRPLEDATALLNACCIPPAQPPRHVTKRVSTVNPLVLPAHDSVTFVALVKSPGQEDVWDNFNRERFNLTARVCYCSVLDECWLLKTGVAEPEKVKRCVAEGPQYH